MIKRIFVILSIFMFLFSTVSPVYAGNKQNKSWSKIKDIFK